MFALKKIVGYLLMPLPLGLGLITVGLLLMLGRRRWRGWFCLVAGWLVLAVAGNRAVSFALTSALEKTYAPAPDFDSRPATPKPDPDATGVEAEKEPGVANAAMASDAETSPPASAPAPPASGAADATESRPETASFVHPLVGTGLVAVLGGGHGDASGLPAGQRLSTSARARLMEGLRLALALPDSWLVVSGPRDGSYGSNPEAQTHARVLADAAVESGFPRERIVEIDTARDTAEEIDALRLLAGGERVALVTSAWHLPRAMKLAEAAGLNAYPCPADYLGGRDDHLARRAYVTWDADSLMNSTRALREYVGQGWARMVAWWKN